MKPSGMAVGNMLQLFIGVFKRYGSLPQYAVDLADAKKLIAKDTMQMKLKRQAIKATIEGRPLPQALIPLSQYPLITLSPYHLITLFIGL